MQVARDVERYAVYALGAHVERGELLEALRNWLELVPV
jgi:hypothetical protein